MVKEASIHCREASVKELELYVLVATSRNSLVATMRPLGNVFFCSNNSWFFLFNKTEPAKDAVRTGKVMKLFCQFSIGKPGDRKEYSLIRASYRNKRVSRRPLAFEFFQLNKIILQTFSSFNLIASSLA
jgi:hypothetical protein